METIFKSKILAVEGKDEIYFFSALFKKLDISDVQILDFQGKTNFPAKIKSIINIPGFMQVKKFALIRDADNKPPESAFSSITKSLENIGLPIPDKINTFINDSISIGIFIMPGNSKMGMLEDLCLKSISENPINKCIENYIDCLPKKPDNISKSKVLCFLAANSPIVNSLGLGAQKGHWNFKSS